jgi:hypothetical protein
VADGDPDGLLLADADHLDPFQCSMSVTTLAALGIRAPTAQQSCALTHVAPNSSEPGVARDTLALAPVAVTHAAMAIKPMAVSLDRAPRRGP